MKFLFALLLPVVVFAAPAKSVAFQIENALRQGISKWLADNPTPTDQSGKPRKLTQVVVEKKTADGQAWAITGKAKLTPNFFRPFEARLEKKDGRLEMTGFAWTGF